MKKLFLIIPFLVLTAALLPDRFLYADENRDAPKKVVIYFFNKGTIKIPEGKKDEKDSFDYLSEILASSIKTDLDN